eukprot:CAMPEP_0202962196 /NCGR_PEP_ID=MMETSP1396-20130829/6293_1 /ASSEMBLY_ACC=CAM_ASM_000872 /TAXON_ID= /ORGANISM="Pseudokeronopsis sp., Strain Brazil" /LENGTH=111 /DNA_ID=CAMNT_0049682597 /DNA_START=320 /DNA_END=655 /DNA_ORIENTATION=-
MRLKKTFYVSEKATGALRAFYENLHLVNLFPLFTPDLEVEVGTESWKNIVVRYRMYGKARQRTSVPSFATLNQLFDPEQIVRVNSRGLGNQGDDHQGQEDFKKAEEFTGID